jgi:hypothetical protein
VVDVEDQVQLLIEASRRRWLQGGGQLEVGQDVAHNDEVGDKGDD